MSASSSAPRGSRVCVTATIGAAGAPPQEGIDEMREEILTVLATTPERWTPGAVSWSLGHGAAGVLGRDPAPEVATELGTLLAEGAIAELTACPVCGAPGVLHVLAGRPADADTAVAPLHTDELSDVLEPMVEAGQLEVAEIVDLDMRPCCARTGRAWRRPPRPA